LFGHVRFSSVLLLAAKFGGAKTKSPLGGGAVSGLEIRYLGLLDDSDWAPAHASASTTTRRTGLRVGAAFHNCESYIDKDALAKGKIQRRWGGKIERLGGAGSARRLAGL
jgi:hypothetical protein